MIYLRQYGEIIDEVQDKLCREREDFALPLLYMFVFDSLFCP